MAAIEPGERFTVEYGNGHQLEVIALAGRKQGRVLSLLSDIGKAEETREYHLAGDKVEEALAICLGGGSEGGNESETERQKRESANAKAADLFDTVLDFESAADIVRSTLSKQALSEDDKKKLELPH
jgi:hypothetical protein